VGYLHVWKILEEIAIDFREKGISVNPMIIGDLRAAKTLINVLKADPRCADINQKIDEHLFNVESTLISEGQKAFGKAYVDQWLERLEEAGKRASEDECESRFVPALPRNQRWVRIRPSAELPFEQLKSLARESQVTYTVQNDGYILISGREEGVKSFVKKIADIYRAEK